MPCINLDLEYFSHRKVLRLCAKLGQWAEIIPLKLWAYTGKFHPENGLLIGYSADELITMIGVRPECNNDASSILQALLDCGFLIPLVNGWEVHQWLEYQGHIAAFSIRGKTAAKARWSKFAEKDLYHATSMPDAMLKQDTSNAPTNYPTDLPTSKSEEEDKIKREPLKRFQAPTISEISIYCSERKNQIDPEKFWAYYESNGWRVGKNPMKSWKAAITTWEKGSNHGTNKHEPFKSKSEREWEKLQANLGLYRTPGDGEKPNNQFLSLG